MIRLTSFLSMVSVCLPSDALLQHLPSYLGFSYLGCGISLHSCSSKAQPLLLTLDKGYLLTAALPDLQRGIAPLGRPAPAQSWLLGRGVGPPGHHPWLRAYIPKTYLFFFLIKFVYYFKKYWDRIRLQYCIGFRCTTK